MKKITLFLSSVLVAASIAGCSPYKTGVEYPDFPDRDIELYDDAVVFEYEGDDEENEITYGVQDDVDDVMEFYQELFEDEDYVILDEEIEKNEYEVEGYIDDIYFEIEVEEADGDEEKYFDAIVNIKTEEVDMDDIYEATYSYDIANARMIVSALSAHNALAEANNDQPILGIPATLEELNDASEIDIYSLSEEDYADAIRFIEYSAQNGFYVVEP